MVRAFTQNQVSEQFHQHDMRKGTGLLGEGCDAQTREAPLSSGRLAGFSQELEFSNALRVLRTVIGRQVEAEKARPRLPNRGSRLVDVAAILVRDVAVAADEVDLAQLAKNADAIAMLEKWLSEPLSEAQEIDFEQTKRSLDANRESPRKLFP